MHGDQCAAEAGALARAAAAALLLGLCRRLPDAEPDAAVLRCGKRRFCLRFVIGMLMLPRHARDKHT